MNKRVLLATLIGFIVSFLLGWLVYGMMFKDMYASGTMAGVNKPEEEMVWWAMLLGNLCWIILFVALFEKMGVSNLKNGAVTALWIGLLIALCYDLYFWGGTNLYTNNQIIFVDLLVTAITSAVTGGVIGWMLGMNKSAA